MAIPISHSTTVLCDIALLKSRETQQGATSPENILHIYKKNVDIRRCTQHKLKVTLEGKPPSQNSRIAGSTEGGTGE